MRPQSSQQSDRAPEPSPALFFETVNAYQRTAALKAAIELDLFTAIGEKNETVQELARRCDASERGLRILCDYLTIIGFLTKEGDHYALTGDSSLFLDRRSSAYLGSSIEFLLSPTHVEAFGDLKEVVRKGGTLMPDGGALAPEHPMWVRFAQVMAPMMALPARLLANIVDERATDKLRVLDIAAGHGMFGIALAERNPRAKITALDWPNVLEVARQNAREAKIEDRFQTIAGSAFEVDYGDGYDLVLLANFLHHFDMPACETILRRVHAALAEDGRVALVEFIPDEDRINPPIAASFSLMMLGTTPNGDAYTLSQFDEMFQRTGFAEVELRAMPPTFFRALVARKR
ncbi:class I SAM-dependent methyltransferase [Pyrinomonas methylaliphatogenes]|uniref:Methylase involved in ubiquinone/menaquinone biosynthesis n=1 Tax=Pyrinomonas methylaliphatogenes TaxID=454194 RepID=A0A0B6WU25_9BACT|nr:class I SAM-dependent methyltransferase [Pyrinomonas methylaliphatogenes]CDM64526.1 methylase involved in ubiquinone/menaquinone biosynthesis [Pyrinomonas methylaliphatogenes]